jgi:hypothetical protein
MAGIPIFIDMWKTIRRIGLTLQAYITAFQVLTAILHRRCKKRSAVMMHALASITQSAVVAVKAAASTVKVRHVI